MDLPLIAPSILAADFSDIAGALSSIETARADWVHLDVMDGQFVPPITFGAKMVSDIRRRTDLPLDVHLMTESPERHVEDFAAAGASYITFHGEACVHAHRLLGRIRELGAKAGLSLVPSTPVCSMEGLLPFLDLVLVMTVNPGYGGQEMLPFCLDKVVELRRLREERGLEFLISVDGGVGSATIGSVAAARPDVLVVGSAFFGADSPGDFSSELRKAYRTRVVC